MNIGEHYITKAYYGTHEITLQQNAYVGTVPMIEDLQPEIWYPFSEDLANHGKLDMTGIGNIASTMTLDSENHCALIPSWKNVSATIETNSTTHEVYAEGRTVNNVTYPAHEFTTAFWIRLSQNALKSFVGQNRIFTNTFIYGYLDNGVFYEDSALTIPITPDSNVIYRNKLSNNYWYWWDGTAYIALSNDSGEFQYITSNVFGYAENNRKYFGLRIKSRPHSSPVNTFDYAIGIRGSSGGQWDTIGWAKMPFDTWVHIAYNYDPATRRIKVYRNGSIIFNSVVPTSVTSGLMHRNWKLQTEGITLGGNYNGVIWPFEYKDIRIYGRVLSNSTIKHIYSLNAPT